MTVRSPISVSLRSRMLSESFSMAPGVLGVSPGSSPYQRTEYGMEEVRFQGMSWFMEEERGLEALVTRWR